VSDLFFRTVSEAGQAFLPISFGLALVRRRHARRESAAIVWGLALAAIASAPAGWLFQTTAHQALWEAALAALALSTVVLVVRRIVTARPMYSWLLCGTALLLVTRQTMEIAAVFNVAAFQLRSASALMSICAAAGLGAMVAATLFWFALRVNERVFSAAARTFCVLFIAQLAMYAFHESAEARLLPWSEPLHAATEPYGPDGIYGQYFSWLLVARAAAAGAIAWRPVWPKMPSGGRVWRFALVALALAGLGDGVWLVGSAGIRPPASIPEIASLAQADHLLFRHTAVDETYSTLSLAPLAQPSSRRISTGIVCERVSFGAGRGICLQASRRVLTTYRALLFDREFKTIATWALDGAPSRTRVAPDGRVGAITVFVLGHGYSSSTFSTKTTLVDMASGDSLGDLEAFSTWRDGVRFKADDFNFWGVTFGPDSNTFYATLATRGKTFLVKGDLALRKLTVLREGVECPSLSPDARHIAFKKRTSDTVGRWRLAVLDVATMTDHLLASEVRNLDDQVEWLDSQHVLYALPRVDSAVTDVWVADIDANTAPRVFTPAAESPIVVHAAR